MVRGNQRGDTLVEVLVATVVLTIVLAGAYAIANRATRINQTSIERTEVANQLNEQAELLRAVRDDHDGTPGSMWSDIVLFAQSSSVGPHDCSNPVADNAFYLTTQGGILGEPEVFSRGGSTPLGRADDAYPDQEDLFDVWIVADYITNTGSDLDNQYEFHVRGCWDGIGGESEQRSEVIFRLRE